MGTDIEYIASKLSREDILCQLAEEAAELAQAALELRRVITGTNPTPVSENDVKHTLNEEIVDVAVAVEAWFKSVIIGIDEIGTDDIKSVLGTFADIKIARWAERLRAVANTNCKPVAPTDAPTDAPTASSKTRQEKFLELFPRAAMRRGVLDICPGKIDTQHCADFDGCLDCQREYWLTAEKEDSDDKDQ